MPAEEAKRFWFIPVLTGNTPSYIHLKGQPLVYPRTYGEHEPELTALHSHLGLSPYLRGTRDLSGQKIPGDLVYPRTYGEHICSGNVKERISGLSPYLRGTQCLYRKPGGKLRFIPVLTGNTQQSDIVLRQITVYPRTYGEHHPRGIRLCSKHGLSPYLRGTHNTPMSGQG
ncbi:hypothetical protein XNW1_1890006 [Xenorhabdus nematophila str. Websteri]|nr:hypothetical protein XNW1_1890006 [Xenorhabdus nematophila str. Websteri]